MQSVTFVLEREGNMVRVRAENLFGFYLADTDEARVVGSIVPLVQHLAWRNRGQHWSEERVFDPAEFLSTGRATITFMYVAMLRPNEIQVPGEFRKNEKGQAFYVPRPSKGTDKKTLERIKAETM